MTQRALVGTLLIVAVVACGIPEHSDRPGTPATPHAETAVPSFGDAPSVDVPSKATMRPSRELPGFLEIREFIVKARDGALALSMSLAEAVPPGSPRVGLVTYRFLLDLDEDGEWDRTAAFELVPGGGYVPVLVDRTSAERLDGARFPGTANLAGPRLSITLPLAELGCPSTIGARASAEQRKGGSTITGGAPGGLDTWTRIETIC